MTQLHEMISIIISHVRSSKWRCTKQIILFNNLNKYFPESRIIMVINLDKLNDPSLLWLQIEKSHLVSLALLRFQKERTYFYYWLFKKLHNIYLPEFYGFAIAACISTWFATAARIFHAIDQLLIVDYLTFWTARWFFALIASIETEAGRAQRAEWV